MSLEQRLHKLHEGRFGADGLCVDATMRGLIAEGEAVLEGVLLNPDDADAPRGDIKRLYTRSEAYPADVYNAGLGLPEQYQRRGFYSALSTKVEAGYREEKIRFIRLTAGRDAGGLAWASTFDFDESRLPGFGEPTQRGAGVGQGGEDVRISSEGTPLELRREIVRRIADAAAASSRISSDERDWLEPLLPELVNPALVRTLPDQVGARMLRRSRWPGVKDLRPI